ncbi:hypothetical protein RUND412_008940, partial [Rhizina undulata]
MGTSPNAFYVKQLHFPSGVIIKSAVGLLDYYHSTCFIRHTSILVCKHINKNQVMCNQPVNGLAIK